MSQTSQAIVHIVRGGGARTASRLCAQWDYLTRKGKIELKRSERYGGSVIPTDELNHWAISWLEQTGNYQLGQRASQSRQELTTHIVVSFPPGTDEQAAEGAGRAWAEDVFGGERLGDSYDYVTAFHTDRPHPHVHVVVNRRSIERQQWLRISHRDDDFNYDLFRERLVVVSERYGIELDATSREQRGLEGPSLTTEQYRQRLRDAVNVFEDSDTAVQEDGELGQGPQFSATTDEELYFYEDENGAGPSSPLRRRRRSDTTSDDVGPTAGVKRRRVEANGIEDVGRGTAQPVDAAAIRADREGSGGQEVSPVVQSAHPSEAGAGVDGGHTRQGKRRRDDSDEHEQTARKRRAAGSGEAKRETRGQRIRRMKAEREARLVARRGDDLVRVVETRAQARARIAQEEAARNASSHSMKLRDTPAHRPRAVRETTR